MNISRTQMLIDAALVLFFFFAPATCNGETHWTGFHGCSGEQKNIKSKAMV
tara:strand:+ start:200 stop:352 length:153 start_codon:yes stop_codon:yes gene_type:complete